MTLKKWEWIPITTPCLKCWVTGALVIILKMKPLAWSWELLTDVYKLDKEQVICYRF